MHHDFRRIKLFFSNGIGDWIMALPTLRAFVRTFGQDVGIVVGSDLPVEMLKEFPATLIETVKVRRGQSCRLIAENCRIGLCDVFISLVPWHHQTLLHLAAKAEAKVTIGLYSCFSIRLPYEVGEHSVDTTFRFFKLFRPNSRPELFSEKPTFADPTLNLVEKIRSRFKGKAIVAVHVDTALNKQPSFDWIDQLLSAVSAELPCIFVLVGKRSYLERIPHAHLEILDSLETCMNIVSEADFFVGVDSCMLHVADFARKPSVGIFVSTPPDEFGFRFAERSLCVNPTLSCSLSFSARHVTRHVKRAIIKGC